MKIRVAERTSLGTDRLSSGCHGCGGIGPASSGTSRSTHSPSPRSGQAQRRHVPPGGCQTLAQGPSTPRLTPCKPNPKKHPSAGFKTNKKIEKKKSKHRRFLPKQPWRSYHALLLFPRVWSGGWGSLGSFAARVFPPRDKQNATKKKGAEEGGGKKRHETFPMADSSSHRRLEPSRLKPRPLPSSSRSESRPSQKKHNSQPKVPR